MIKSSKFNRLHLSKEEFEALHKLFGINYHKFKFGWLRNIGPKVELTKDLNYTVKKEELGKHRDVIQRLSSHNLPLFHENDTIIKGNEISTKIIVDLSLIHI